MNAPAGLPVLVEGFFTKRLIAQRKVSAHTVASYRDTFRLLLGFAAKRLARAPSELLLTDLDATLVAAFLDHIEKTRANGARSRNQRLAAIRSFFRYAALEAPEHSALIARTLAIPSKRHTRPLVDFLTRPELEALLAAPERGSWIGRRDHAFLLTALQTGLRLSELTGLQIADVAFGAGAHIRCIGKGRKERCTPLVKATAKVLRAWIKERNGQDTGILFPSARGGRLSADAVQRLVSKHAKSACEKCPSLAGKRVTPHVLRHTAAMELLQAGVDSTMIALWLGHESVETTRIYLDANLAIKEEILAKTRPLKSAPHRYKPSDRLLDFLDNL
jgi:integrase/recombinase XerD